MRERENEIQGEGEAEQVREVNGRDTSNTLQVFATYSTT